LAELPLNLARLEFRAQLDPRPTPNGVNGALDSIGARGWEFAITLDETAPHRIGVIQVRLWILTRQFIGNIRDPRKGRLSGLGGGGQSTISAGCWRL
jgi:hypothetical protein